MAKILIVEDEKRIQDIIIDYLTRDGHDCLRADDGVDALVILKNNSVDMMILDIMMPHMDGFSVCKIAREISNLPIIILTAKQDESDKLRGYELGADDYITKPFSPNILMAKVRALQEPKREFHRVSWQSLLVFLVKLFHQLKIHSFVQAQNLHF